MAHTFGTNSAHTSATANPTTFSFTVDPLDTVLVLMLKVDGATDRTGGAPTFAGMTMVQANSTQKAAASPEAGAEIWYLTDAQCSGGRIPIGSGTCSIPNAGALTLWHMMATGRAKPGGRSAFDVANGANATATNPSPGSVTTTTDGAILFAVVATGAQTWAPSAQAGTSLNNTDDGATGTGRQYLLQSSLGSATLSWTFGTSDDYGAVVAAFKEILPQGFNNYFGVDAGTGISVTEKIR